MRQSAVRVKNHSEGRTLAECASTLEPEIEPAEPATGWRRPKRETMAHRRRRPLPPMLSAESLCSADIHGLAQEYLGRHIGLVAQPINLDRVEHAHAAARAQAGKAQRAGGKRVIGCNGCFLAGG